MDKGKIIEKLLSGRYYLTLIGGIVFLYATYKKIIPPEAVVSIITMIFISYFERKDRTQNEQGGVK